MGMGLPFVKGSPIFIFKAMKRITSGVIEARFLLVSCKPPSTVPVALLNSNSVEMLAPHS